jgi:pimeloyl-ACP methyl ester carboxylesterase
MPRCSAPTSGATDTVRRANAPAGSKTGTTRPYNAAAARLPAQLERSGVLVSKLVVIGVSYSGFANAELVATHPDLRPAALIVVDSFLDLTARFGELPGLDTGLVRNGQRASPAASGRQEPRVLRRL